MPASSGAIRAGRAFVELALRDDTTRGLKAASQRLAGFGSQVTRIGAGLTAASGAILGALTAATAHFAEVGAGLNKLSSQTGDSVEELSRMQHAATKTGVDVDDLAGSIEELNIRLGESIRDGTGPAHQALQQLGLDSEKLAGLPLSQRFGAIADALNQVQDAAMRGFLADEIFGGDAFKILPLLRQGSQGMAQLAQQSDALGKTLSGSQAQAAAQLKAAWTELRAAWDGAVTQIGSALAPVLTQLLQIVVSIAQPLIGFIKNNQALVIGVAAVATGVGILGGVLTALGAAASLASFAMGAFGTISAIALSPITLIVAAIAALVAGLAALATWFLTSTKAGQDFVAYVQDALAPLLDTLRGGFTVGTNKRPTLGAAKKDVEQKALAEGQQELAAAMAKLDDTVGEASDAFEQPPPALSLEPIDVGDFAATAPGAEGPASATFGSFNPDAIARFFGGTSSLDRVTEKLDELIEVERAALKEAKDRPALEFGA